MEGGHVAILPAPGMGHLIPLVEFAKRLIHNKQQLSVTLLILPTSSSNLSTSQNLFLQASLPNAINYTLLPPVNLDDFPASSSVKIETRLALTVTRSLPNIRDAIKSLLETTRLVCFVADTFGADAFDIAREFNVSPYLFYGSSAMCLSFAFCLPELDQKVCCEFRDMDHPLRIPGTSISVHGKDFFEPLQDRKNDAYKWILHLTKKSFSVDGIIINTFKSLEPETLKALLLLRHEKEKPTTPPIYPVGPLVKIVNRDDDDHNQQRRSSADDCLTWLDDQPIGSVLYVSFGSGGTLSYNQFVELALGLEMSEQRFIWVVRCPNDVQNASYLGDHDQENNNINSPLGYLPKGLLQRIKGRGLVVPNWAPQPQILSHASTGGFLTHCGWSSVLESVVNGVPLIAWPLFAEQKMNAVLLSEVLKVALMRPHSIQRLHIVKVVKSLMEGEEGKQLRSRIRELKDAAKQHLSQHGSSTKSLAELASKLLMDH